MGHHNRVFSGDKYALHGFWSPPTSAANFCEEDYVVTRYIAEFINSLTNLSYAYFALRYMYGLGSRGLLRPRFDVLSLSLLGVGLGSFLYHATLRQTLQFVDDLSMLFAGAAMLHGVYTVRQTPFRSRLISVLIFLCVTGFSAFYVWSGKIVYHTLAFTLQIILNAARGVYLYNYIEPKFPVEKVRSWRRRQWGSMGIFLLGYVLWNIDLEFCMELRAIRERMGLPWAWGLELHGWWHILTAIGADRFMVVVREIREAAQDGEKGAKEE